VSFLSDSASVCASFGCTLRNKLHYTVDGDGGCIDWAGFEEWLKRRGLSRKHRVDVLNKARKYSDVLLLGDFKLLRDAVNKRHVLAALSNLARFLGVYGKWRMMLMQNDVSWSDGKNDAEWVFRRIYDEEIDDLDSWIEILKERANSWLWNYVVFLGLSGLRPNEAVIALNLVKEGKLKSYLNREVMTLEHFRFSRLFLRNTKKAFITVLTDKMLLLLGGSCVTKILQSGNYEAVVGVTCGEEIKLASKILEKLKLPGQAVPPNKEWLCIYEI